MRQKKVTSLFTGIHLASPGIARCAFVGLTGSFIGKNLTLNCVYEKVGVHAAIFSDDGLMDLIRHHRGIAEIVIDTPLSVPPCVACLRDVCPGVISCDDVKVAYMLALTEKIKESSRRRRRRPVNPQTQRLWDVMQQLTKDSPPCEPTYTTNHAPLIVRAQVLQRRIKHYDSQMYLKETSVPRIVKWLIHQLNLRESLQLEYRTFAKGVAARRKIVNELFAANWIKVEPGQQMSATILYEHLEVFQALLCALVAAWCHEGLCPPPDQSYAITGEWIHLPNF